jgi:hypothetical protein
MPRLLAHDERADRGVEHMCFVHRSYADAGHMDMFNISLLHTFSSEIRKAVKSAPVLILGAEARTRNERRGLN